MKTTRVQRQFFKSYRHLPWHNKNRRFIVSWMLLWGSAVVMGRYAYTYNYGVPASALMTDTMKYFGIHRLSSSLGGAADSIVLPHQVHQQPIRLYIWCFSVDMSESSKSADEMETLQDLFTRELKAGVRTVDSSALLTSPCDGVLIGCDRFQDNLEVPIKGSNHRVANFFHVSEPRLPPVPQDHERYCFTFRLRAKDYHHVHSPCRIHLSESVHVPGELLPLTQKGLVWTPKILIQNERVCLVGTSSDRDDAHHQQPPVFVGMALIGSFITGKIDVKFDGRIATNLAHPPLFAVHHKYGDRNAESPLSRREVTLNKGEDIARFRMGSAVVLVTDLPKQTTIVAKVGDEVKVGGALVKPPVHH
jgi:phosphatidylserine decarboxylase